MKKFRSLSIKTIESFRKVAQRLGVSKVARSKRGFMTALAKAGSVAKLSPKWQLKRINFIKRHYAQLKKNKEPLFKNGLPARRHLALIFWAYSPAASRLKRRVITRQKRAWTRKTRRNPEVEYADRRDKKFTIYNVGHDGAAELWIQIGGKVFTESDRDENEEERYHNDIWPSVSDKWRGRYETGSGILSAVVPRDPTHGSRMPPKLMNQLVGLFNPERIIVFT